MCFDPAGTLLQNHGMDATQILSWVISIMSSVTTIIFGWFAFRRNQKSDDRQAATNLEKLGSDIHYIKKNIADINQSIGDMRKSQTDIIERLAKAEQKIELLESAWKQRVRRKE